MWTGVWMRKFLKMPAQTSCADLAKSVEILLSPETGTGRGRLRQRGKDRETGNSGGFSGPGDRVEQRQRPSNRQVSVAKPGEAPPSHAWRGLALFMPAFFPA